MPAAHRATTLRERVYAGARDRLPGWDETIGNDLNRPHPGARHRPLRDRPLNRETLGDRPTPLTITQRTTNLSHRLI